MSFRCLFGTCALLLVTILAAAVDTAAVIVRVVDGDTLAVRLESGKSDRVRLVGIDAPEMAQPWGVESKAALTKWAEGRTARLEVKARDHYGRALANVWVGNSWLNQRLVKEGQAWGESKAFHALQEGAKKARVGLWSADSPTPPWKWRHPKKEAAVP